MCWRLVDWSVDWVPNPGHIEAPTGPRFLPQTTLKPTQNLQFRGPKINNIGGLGESRGVRSFGSPGGPWGVPGSPGRLPGGSRGDLGGSWGTPGSLPGVSGGSCGGHGGVPRGPWGPLGGVPEGSRGVLGGSWDGSRGVLGRSWGPRTPPDADFGQIWGRVGVKVGPRSL